MTKRMNMSEDYIPEKKDLGRHALQLNLEQRKDLFFDIVRDRLDGAWELSFVEYAPDYADAHNYEPVREYTITEEWYDQFNSTDEMFDAFRKLMEDGRFPHKYGNWDKEICNTINEHMIANYIWGECQDDDRDYRLLLWNEIESIRKEE